MRLMVDDYTWSLLLIDGGHASVACDSEAPGYQSSEHSIASPLRTELKLIPFKDNHH